MIDARLFCGGGGGGGGRGETIETPYFMLNSKDRLDIRSVPPFPVFVFVRRTVPVDSIRTRKRHLYVFVPLITFSGLFLLVGGPATQSSCQSDQPESTHTIGTKRPSPTGDAHLMDPGCSQLIGWCRNALLDAFASFAMTLSLSLSVSLSLCLSPSLARWIVSGLAVTI